MTPVCKEWPGLPSTGGVGNNDKLEEQQKEMKKYDSKEAEAANLQNENRELKKDLKEKEIKLIQNQVKQVKFGHQRRCESEAGDHEAEKEGLKEQTADLQECNATLQSRLEEEGRKNRALTRQIREESELTRADAEHNERVKSLKRREKRKEEEADEERGELESELRRRDKRIEALKRQFREQERKTKLQSSASDRRSRAWGAAGRDETPPAAATDGARGAAGGRDKPRQAAGSRGKARKATESDEPVQVAGRREGAGRKADRRTMFKGVANRNKSSQEVGDESSQEDDSDESSQEVGDESSQEESNESSQEDDSDESSQEDDSDESV
ncbi:cilia- and flagella-associated protein 251-like [Penaeus monodon]|uniref:cilia- and flagella-associated protein 251-like n=1 Tax=Penaeus monodon TaxID=6687 RepID=UPI0018A6FFE4|nr:cilia- and flagella-associated protein 251-like [Penaeus monodon]